MAQVVSQALRIPRIALAAGVIIAVVPPGTFKVVDGGNGTGGDLYLFTDVALTEYVVISAGYERPFPLTSGLFQPGLIAFWLRADLDGTAVLVWR